MEFSELILKVNEWFKNHSDAEINDILNNIKCDKILIEFLREFR